MRAASALTATRSVRAALRGPNRRLQLAQMLASAIEPGHYVQIPYPPASAERPRYGYGRPSHALLAAAIARDDALYATHLHELMAYADDLRAIPAEPGPAGEPHWDNGFMLGLDGVSLYAFTRDRRPRRYVEIGSGNSTLFVARARRDGALPTQITSIDPAPRREVDGLCDVVVRAPLEDSDLSLFDELAAGDVVFMDGTHRTFMNSDATVFFLDILPALANGVLVGVHDIHLPDDYPPESAYAHYSEQYLLAAYLLAEGRWLRPLLPCWYVAHTPALQQIVSPLFAAPPLDTLDPRGRIFWMTVERP
jgi:predicted O-methyltransferase YrrM